MGAMRNLWCIYFVAIEMSWNLNRLLQVIKMPLNDIIIIIIINIILIIIIIVIVVDIIILL